MLGGGLVEAMPDLIVSESRRIGPEKSFFLHLPDTFTVVPAELGDDSTAMGAAAWVREFASRAVG